MSDLEKLMQKRLKLQEQMAALRVELRALTKQIDEKAIGAAAAEKVAGMSDEEKAALKAALS